MACDISDHQHLAEENDKLRARIAELETEAQKNENVGFSKERRRFQSLVNSFDDLIFTLDREGRHTGVYGRWLQTAGITADMFLGKTAGEILGKDATSELFR